MAISKPLKLPIWDTNATNLVEPQNTNQSDGWQVDANGIPQKPPFQYHNYMWHTQYKWFEYLDAEKALVGGNATQTFKAKAGVASDDVVNKSQLDTKLPSSSYTASDVLAKVKTVDGSGSGLDADTVDGVQGALLGIGGAGYAWVDETANRVSGTTYTNTFGHPIQISISFQMGDNSTLGYYIDGIKFSYYGTVNAYNFGVPVSFIVPSGSTYKADIGAYVLKNWNELK